MVIIKQDELGFPVYVCGEGGEENDSNEMFHQLSFHELHKVVREVGPQGLTRSRAHHPFSGRKLQESAQQMPRFCLFYFMALCVSFSTFPPSMIVWGYYIQDEKCCCLKEKLPDFTWNPSCRQPEF